MLIGKQATDETLLEWAKYLLDQNKSIDEINYACEEAIRDPNLNPYVFTVAKLLKNKKSKMKTYDPKHPELFV